MMFSVIWHPKARKSMKRLERSLASRIFKKVDELREDPFRFVERLHGYDVYKLRVGPYRVLRDIDMATTTIEIQMVDHRKRIYKEL